VGFATTPGWRQEEAPSDQEGCSQRNSSNDKGDRLFVEFGEVQGDGDEFDDDSQLAGSPSEVRHHWHLY
jgi:hypothetical protein